MNKITIGLLGAALIGVPLAAKAYADHRVYAIDANPVVPPQKELLNESYVRGLSHGQIAMFRQYNRIYPNLVIDASKFAATGDAKTITLFGHDTRYPQVILSDKVCIVEMKLGQRSGERCLPD